MSKELLTLATLACCLAVLHSATAAMTRAQLEEFKLAFKDDKIEVGGEKNQCPPLRFF